MAVGAEKVGSFATHKVSCPFPMDACLPVSVDVPVTFTAEPVTLREIDEFPIVKPEFIPILSIVAVQTPSHGLGVMELDRGVFVFEVPLFPIDFHGGVTVAAREHPFRNRRRRNRELFCCHGRGDKKHCRHNRDHHSETY